MKVFGEKSPTYLLMLFFLCCLNFLVDVREHLLGIKMPRKKSNTHTHTSARARKTVRSFFCSLLQHE